MLIFFFFNDTATTEIYTLSLHDALPILRHRRALPRDPRLRQARRELASRRPAAEHHPGQAVSPALARRRGRRSPGDRRSEEHTSELQSRQYLVCRLLLEKKNKQCRSCQY